MAPDSDSQSSLEERAGPSGNQKKARTISSTEFLQVSSGGAEVVEMGGVSVSGEDGQPGQPQQVENMEEKIQLFLREVLTNRGPGGNPPCQKGFW